jgi:hypothetical protein
MSQFKTSPFEENMVLFQSQVSKCDIILHEKYSIKDYFFSMKASIFLSFIYTDYQFFRNLVKCELILTSVS